MTVVKVRNIELGSGIPKICVPIVASSEEEILKKASEIRHSDADIVEWRIDFYEDVFHTEQLAALLEKVNTAISPLPLLMTFRTKKEGGAREISTEQYVKLNIAAAESGYADLIDVEIFSGDETVSKIITEAHKSGTKVIASNHDFFKTPSQEEIVKRLCFMQDMGADIAKIAVMPQNRKDVLALLSATEEMTSEHTKTPVITMSMSSAGVISRMCGEVFGSCLTFGALGTASAPGQMRVDDLSTVLQLVHKSL